MAGGGGGGGGRDRNVYSTNGATAKHGVLDTDLASMQQLLCLALYHRYLKSGAALYSCFPFCSADIFMLRKSSIKPIQSLIGGKLAVKTFSEIWQQ